MAAKFINPIEQAKKRAQVSENKKKEQAPEKAPVNTIELTRKPVQIQEDSPGYPLELIDASSKTILQGIIWSEILGKPKSLRKGR